MNKTPTIKTVKKRVEAALQILLINDKYLLEHNLHERTITHKFAEYLQILFKNWHVDCEYNRDGCDPKLIQIPTQEEESSVFPDIIVHRRGSEDNLLIIEVKKSSNRNRNSVYFDQQKLQAYRDSPLNYKYGLFLIFDTENPTHEKPYELSWYA